MKRIEQAITTMPEYSAFDVGSSPGDSGQAPINHPPGQTAKLSGKRVVDILLGTALLIVAGPIILVCSVLIRLTSRGPAIYSQTRLGWGGRPFRIYKLRSMTHNCEKASGVRWATHDDPRVTFLGKILRMTHLDELPQLWNVIRGDMSLVGPRPERPEFIPVLEASIPHYRERLGIRPGVTGLAQVYLSPDTGIESVKRKLHYDLVYLRDIGLWLDFRILVATPLQAIGIPPAWVRRCLRLPSPETIERTYCQ